MKGSGIVFKVVKKWTKGIGNSILIGDIKKSNRKKPGSLPVWRITWK
jgi:hypothetical protein